MNILFTYLVAFSGNGGIERFNRCFILAMEGICQNLGYHFSIRSLYDSSSDPHYTKGGNFTGFKRNKVWYILSTILLSKKINIAIIGHINLYSIGLILKKLNPKVKIIFIAHGIEVWRDMSVIRKIFLSRTDLIIAVSEFTRQVLMDKFGIDGGKIVVCNNTIDPYFEIPSSFEKNEELLKNYWVNNNEKIILTVNRISSFEKYKGYDNVLLALGELSNQINFKYLLVGKYDSVEYERLNTMINHLNLQEKVILVGYVEEEELIEHYLSADIFIMPSKKEGFGIVFIEAAVCGADIIAGNKDGSVDALDHGRFGTLVDPDNVKEIKDAIETHLLKTRDIYTKRKLQQDVIEKFGFYNYKEQLRNIISSI
jgi:phosphatidylinositol alpha-1,6-mannosyltransferase